MHAPQISVSPLLLVGHHKYGVHSSHRYFHRRALALIPTSTICALYYTLYHQHHHHGLSTPISYHGECSGEARFVQ